jgi:hypothetical protein
MRKTLYRSEPQSVRHAPRRIGSDGRPVERRGARRTAELPLAVVVSAPGLARPLDCALRDRSTTGARLEIEPRRAGGVGMARLLPDLVLVWMCSKQIELPARIIWRDGRHLGVAFVGGATRRTAGAGA